MLAVIVAGCSSAPAGTGSSGSNSAAATHQKAVKFAECMRDDGVSDSDGAGTVSPMSDAVYETTFASQLFRVVFRLQSQP
jgi:hypothetical protein